MIDGIGIDIIELDRIEKLRNRQEAFSKRILTSQELAYFLTLSEHRQVEFLAGRFAAKEAFSKALGTGIGKELSFQDIEILPNKQNKPVIKTENYSGAVHLSISHSKNAAIAQVILENN